MEAGVDEYRQVTMNVVAHCDPDERDCLFVLVTLTCFLRSIATPQSSFLAAAKGHHWTQYRLKSRHRDDCIGGKRRRPETLIQVDMDPQHYAQRVKENVKIRGSYAIPAAAGTGLTYP